MGSKYRLHFVTRLATSSSCSLIVAWYQGGPQWPWWPLVEDIRAFEAPNGPVGEPPWRPKKTLEKVCIDFFTTTTTTKLVVSIASSRFIIL
jgi:hypothetical protein